MEIPANNEISKKGDTKTMPDHAQHVARMAADIMFSNHYLDLLEKVYSEQDTIMEFETNPRRFLAKYGVHVPEYIEIIIHESGAVGRPARVDFHWSESTQTAHSDKLASRQELRELARLAWDVLHSREMEQLKKTVRASSGALKEFASNPKAYAEAHQVTLPNGLDIVVHLEDGNDPRIDIHFGPQLRTEGGCCYCRGGGCCYYA